MTNHEDCIRRLRLLADEALTDCHRSVTRAFGRDEVIVHVHIGDSSDVLRYALCDLSLATDHDWDVIRAELELLRKRL